MNQLLIVNSQKAINAKAVAGGDNVTAFNFSNLAKGAISFFELGASTLLSAAPTKNFGIALGGGENVLPFMIPEVDLSTLSVVKALPTAGNPFSAVITPASSNAAAGKSYSIILIKRGTVPNERNKYTVSTFVPKDVTKTNIAVFKELGKQLKEKVEGACLDVTVAVNASTGVITVTGTNTSTDWVVKLGDDGFGVVASDSRSGAVLTETYADGSSVATTQAVITVGDKAYVQALAQKCAAGKGFTNTDLESQHIYTGYPEAVEDLVPNTSGTGGASTAGYAIYTLRFATGRVAGKQTDERIWQNVYIAVPITNASFSTIDAILCDAKSDDQAVKES